jgi:hypothetical protein
MECPMLGAIGRPVAPDVVEMNGDVREFADRIRPFLGKTDEESLWKIRSELNRLRHACSGTARTGGDASARVLEKLLDINRASYDFSLEIRGKLSAESYNKLATLFDLGTIGAIVGQDFLSGEGVDVTKLMTGMLAEALVVLGSVQYVQAWSEECETLIMKNALYLHDAFWGLPDEYGIRRQYADDELTRIQDGLDRFFGEMKNRKIQQEARIALLGCLYGFIFRLYLKRLLEKAGES